VLVKRRGHRVSEACQKVDHRQDGSQRPVGIRTSICGEGDVEDSQFQVTLEDIKSIQSAPNDDMSPHQNQ
jgi:hypothetical protein